MKKYLLISFAAALLPLSAFAYTSPGKPSGFVNDFAKVLPVQDRQMIEAKLQVLKNSTGDELTVVTIPSLGDETIETYAVKLFQEWGIGNKDKDNGLLILVAPNDRQARIEVGYGLEGTITDLQSGNIIRNVMIPVFKNNNYSGGISGAVDAVSAIITGSPEAAQYSVPSETDSSSGTHFSFASIFFIGFVIFNILARVLGKTKSWWLGGVIGAVVGIIIGLIFGFIFAGVIAIIVLTILGLIFDYFVSKHPPGSGRSGGFWPIFLGGGRGGSGGSGFGGFGGGSSGGGGASGSW